MGTLPPPTEYFPGIIFNEAYYKAANFIVTKEYIDNNFLKSVGYAYSRAIFTNFSGLVYAIGGISTSDITATGTITAAFFTGSGANLTNLNASNISTGTLSVSRGGTGLNTIPLGSLLIGNGANTLLQTTNLSWDNTNSILNATNFSGSYSGSGAGLINLNVSNANAGTLPIGRGGTGTTTFISGRLLYGDGVNPLAQSANLTWNNTNNTLNTTNVNSSAYFINGSPFTPYTDTNTRTVLSTSAGTNMTWNTGTNKFDVTATTYILPIATTTILGGVKSDNDTVSIDGTGIIKVSGNSKYLISGTFSYFWGWNGVTSLLGRVGIAGDLSTASLVEDIVLRSQGRLILQSGTTNPAMTINTSNNIGIGTTTPNYKLDVNGTMNATIYRTNGVLTSQWLAVGTSISNSNTGNVGIGIDTPASLLHLQKSALNQEVKIQLTDNTTGFTATDGLAIYKGTDQNGYFWNYENNDLIFGTNATEKMRILAGGNIGIGITNPPFALLHLHKTALAQDVRIQFTDGTTGAASTDGLVIGKGTNGRNFIYNYENSDLYFGTNTLERMTISGAGNVGIANTAPIAPLTIGNSALANNDGFLVLEKCTTVGTTRQFRIGLNANFDLAMGDYGGNNVAGTWLESFKISYQSPANALVINSSGNIGVNTSNPTSKVHINHSSTSTSPDSGGSIALYVNNPTNLLNNNSIICNRVAGILCGKVIYSLDVYGAHGWSIYITAISNVFRINNSYTASGTDVLTIDQAGNATIYGSIAGTGIISSSFLQGSGAGGAYRIVRPDTWVRLKNTADTDHLDFAAGRLYAHYQLDVVGAATFSAFTIHNAEVRVRMQSVSNTANEFVCIKTTGGTTDGPLGNYYDKILYIAYNTFTGFHRCYVEDELCNDDNIDIFKNDFVGRIVISTGKIKTDASRKKIIENQLEDTPDEYEWYSLEDKEGITIEDALPKVQLSRIRKDKRVYGVLGEPNRGTNNKDRIIVNGCGEGAICVCNRNGNIENGDYIQTSDILGYGEKQDDDIHRNYTVAKAVMDCSFELDSPYYQCEELASGVRVAIIACVYKAS